MKENKRNIDEFFLEELGNTTEAPPSLVWQNLEKRLDDNKSDSRQKNWWFYLLFAALLIGGSIAAYYASHKTAAPSFGTLNTPLSNKEKNTSNTNQGNENNTEKNDDESGTEENTNSNTASVKNINQSPTSTESKENKGFATNNVGGNSNNQTSTAAQNAKVNGRTSLGKTTGRNTNFSQVNTKAKKSANDENSVSTKQAQGTGNENSNALGNGINKTLSQTGTAKEKQTNKGGTSTNASSIGNNSPSNISATKEENTSSKNTVAALDPKQNSGTELKENASKKKSQLSAVSKENKSLSAKVATNEKANVASNDVLAQQKKTNELNATKTAPKVPITPVAAEEKVIKFNEVSAEKTKAKLAQQQKAAAQNNVRNLSGVSDEDKAEYEAEAAKMQNDNDFEPETKSKETPLTRPSQIAAIEKLRAQNPLSGAPLAANAPEDVSAGADGTAKGQESSGSSGGGGAAQKKEKAKRQLNMTIGVKAGYEMGAASYTANKFVGTIFGEVNFGKKLSFIVQPSIKMAKTNRQYQPVSSSYFKADGTTSSLYNVVTDSAGKPVRWDFAQQQNYDSIVVSVLTENRFIEIEIPFLFRYKIDQHFAILGGMNFSFGKTLGSSVNFNTIKGVLNDTIRKAFDSTIPAPSSKFAHAGSKPFSSYIAPESSDAPSPIRFGYTIGFSYAFREKLMIDLLLQQNLSGLSNIKDPDTRKIFAQPYVRLSLGYVLFGGKKK